MRMLRIKTYENGEPDNTVSFPLFLASAALRFIPKQAKEQMAAEGIDIQSILRSVTEDASGTLLEVENHSDNQKVVIAIE